MKLHAALLIALALVVVCCCSVRAVEPPPIDDGGVQGLDLKTQLQKGLRARRPVEFEYIDQIVHLVETRKLPIKLVYSTFGWARHQPSRPLQHFQFALQARTRGMKIDMPDLKKQAVGIGGNGGQHGFQGNPVSPGTITKPATFGATTPTTPSTP